MMDISMHVYDNNNTLFNVSFRILWALIYTNMKPFLDIALCNLLTANVASALIYDARMIMTIY